MKKILLALLLIPSLAWANPVVIENDLITNPQSGYYIVGRQNEAQTSITTTAGDAIAPSFDRYGNNICSLTSGTAAAGNPIKLEDAQHTSSDAGFPFWGVTNPQLGGAFTASTNDYSPIATNLNGAVYTHMWYDNSPFSAVTLEDKAAVSTDAGIPSFGFRNDNLGNTLTSANGDYGNISIGNRGEVLIGGSYQEDAAWTDSFYTAVVGAVREDALTVSTSASGDVSNIKTDAAGRLVTTSAPAGETFQSCGTATAVTTDVAIKASVASNRIYTTTITCKNTSTTVGPTLDFKDGATIIAVGGITATSATGVLPASFVTTFNPPLRGTSATALNFATNTATSSVTCCAAGYISVN